MPIPYPPPSVAPGEPPLGRPLVPAGRPARILLVKLNHLGDTLLLTPTLDFLQREFPEGLELDVLVRRGSEALLAHHPAIRRLVSLAAPERGQRSATEGLREFWRTLRAVGGRCYDFAFALTESDRALLWLWLSRARVRAANDAYGNWGWKRRLLTHVGQFPWGPEHQVLRDFRLVADLFDPAARPGPLRFFPRTDAEAVRRRLPELTDAEGLAVIHPTSRWAFKQWLPGRWAEVADRLREGGLTVLLSCGPDPREIETVHSIQAAAVRPHLATLGRLSLEELGWLLGRARLFLGVDTVAMHLAAAMQTPSVALFGPSSEWSWRPWQCRHELVLGECSCKATRRFVCDKTRPYPCMERITTAEVLAAVERLLGSAAGTPAPRG